MEIMKKYRGVVKDKLKALEDKKTRWYATHQDAHAAAERLCKRTMGGRGTISVMDGDGYKY
ncbi:MAG: hypothetical protein BWX44_00082 [Spirochaetes bacterium ADurb.Bin001]|nr:MAG: hypothetical protein BWX44_00082 [Spirochaetes bacterium ADurb.Bin001]